MPFQSSHLKAKCCVRTGVVMLYLWHVFWSQRKQNQLLSSVVQRKWIRSIVLIRIQKAWIESDDLLLTKSPRSMPLLGWHVGGVLLFESLIKKLCLNFVFNRLMLFSYSLQCWCGYLPMLVPCSMVWRYWFWVSLKEHWNEKLQEKKLCERSLEILLENILIL